MGGTSRRAESSYLSNLRDNRQDFKKTQLVLVIKLVFIVRSHFSICLRQMGDSSPLHPCVPFLVYCQQLLTHTHTHTSPDWQDIYSRPTGLWQVMRSPTEQDVIILASMRLKQRKRALWPRGCLRTLHAHAQRRSQTLKTCTDKDEAALQQKKSRPQHRWRNYYM